MENKKYKCLYCDREFDTIQARSSHQGQCYQNPKNQNQVFTCQYCKIYSTSTKTGIGTHEALCKSNPKMKPAVYHKTICDKCGKEITNCNFKRHYISCGTKKIGSGYHLDHDDLFCKFCGKEYKNKNSLRQHECRCKKNPNSINISTAGIDAMIKKNQEQGPWCKGLTKETDIRVLNGALSLRQYYYNHPDQIKNLHAFFKYGWYKNYWCDSSWELAVVVYCLDNNISIQRNKDSFEYISTDNFIHRYFPDFIINNEYYEIKGEYSTEDYLKIEQFPIKLNIIDSTNINKYLSYTKNKYGNNFTEVLYDKDRPNYTNTLKK